MDAPRVRSGVGKTRLAEQLAVARGEGVRVLRGGCVPLGGEGVPFAPVIQALRGLAGPARAELARLLPDLVWGGEAALAAMRRAPAKQRRGGCSSCCWGWSSAWPARRRCCG